ncbi:MAG: mandelate racemase/muconate lactonizing enzyme family protein [Chloroflexota bacterium]|nr:mandelate racemase/muconate lactonizing enzyme family protein [Chloroflexota bacterium]
MKVTGVKTFLVQPETAKAVLFVKVETDAGIHGWGEVYTVTAREPSLERLTLDLGQYLIGRDPLHIKHYTQAVYRDVAIKRGSMDFYCAISGLEIALWDIAGKHFNTPVYNLLGGPCRGTLRIYGQPSGDAGGATGAAALGRRAANTVAQGYSALKFDPFPGPWQTYVERDVERAAVERVAAVREAVGPEVDILIEVHRRLAPRHAIWVAHQIERYDPFWYEEPTPAENVDATVDVRRKINIPVIVGEALYTKHEFREVFEKQAADIINPDICNVGGLLELKEIAAMAEAYCVAVAPHGNNSTTVGLAASLQVGACIPNFLIMEYPMSWEPVANEIAKNPLRVEHGTIALPTAPGIGIDLDEDALAKYPYRGPRKGTLIEPWEERP